MTWHIREQQVNVPNMCLDKMKISLCYRLCRWVGWLPPSLHLSVPRKCSFCWWWWWHLMIQRVFSLVMTEITGLGVHSAGPQVSLLDNFDPIFLKILNDARRRISISEAWLKLLCLWRTDLKLYSSFKENSGRDPETCREKWRCGIMDKQREVHARAGWWAER